MSLAAVLRMYCEAEHETTTAREVSIPHLKPILADSPKALSVLPQTRCGGRSWWMCPRGRTRCSEGEVVGFGSWDEEVSEGGAGWRGMDGGCAYGEGESEGCRLVLVFGDGRDERLVRKAEQRCVDEKRVADGLYGSMKTREEMRCGYASNVGDWVAEMASMGEGGKLHGFTRWIRLYRVDFVRNEGLMRNLEPRQINSKGCGEHRESLVSANTAEEM